MFYTRSSSTDTETPSADTFAARAMLAGSAAAQNAAAAAQIAAQGMSGRAQVAAAGLSKGVQQGVVTARGWAAPQLESAADYCTSTLAPKVAAALKASARQVSPEPAATQNAKRPTALTWAMLAAAVLAALGAAGALARYRYRAAIAAETAEDPGSRTAAEAADKTLSPDSPANVPGQGGRAAPSPDSTVNGRVSANGW